MYNKNLPRCQGLTDEFCIGLEQFLEFASSKIDFMDGYKLRRPCRKCSNGKFHVCDKVREYLCRFCFTLNYYNWTCHGEPLHLRKNMEEVDKFLIEENKIMTI